MEELTAIATVTTTVTCPYCGGVCGRGGDMRGETIHCNNCKKTIKVTGLFPAHYYSDICLRSAATEPRAACKTMLDAWPLIPMPDCQSEQSQEEFRELLAAREDLISATTKATGKETEPCQLTH